MQFFGIEFEKELYLGRFLIQVNEHSARLFKGADPFHIPGVKVRNIDAQKLLIYGTDLPALARYVRAEIEEKTPLGEDLYAALFTPIHYFGRI